MELYGAPSHAPDITGAASETLISPIGECTNLVSEQQSCMSISTGQPCTGMSTRPVTSTQAKCSAKLTIVHLTFYDYAALPSSMSIEAHDSFPAVPMCSTLTVTDTVNTMTSIRLARSASAHQCFLPRTRAIKNASHLSLRSPLCAPTAPVDAARLCGWR